jgi:hypothetical protein
MGRLAESIRKYSERVVAGVRPVATGIRSAPDAGRPSRHALRDGLHAKSRRATPERVARRPDPDLWSADELLALHEACALLWPSGPVTVSSLRTAIGSGELAYVRIAGRIYTTRAAVAAMTECRKAATAGGGSGAPDDTDWDGHLATLLPRRGGGAR